MSTSILTTKLYIPPPQPNLVHRPRLVERLNVGLHGSLTLISAPAGFGKTTLVSAWLAGGKRRVAWLSLDDSDNNPSQFLTYLLAALQSIDHALGAGMLKILQSPLGGTAPIGRGLKLSRRAPLGCVRGRCSTGTDRKGVETNSDRSP